MAANVTRHADNFLLALKTIKNAEELFGHFRGFQRGSRGLGSGLTIYCAKLQNASGSLQASRRQSGSPLPLSPGFGVCPSTRPISRRNVCSIY